MSEPRNIQQRVFEAIPGQPLSINLQSLYLLVPFDHASIRSAIQNLRALELVEPMPGERGGYRRTGKAMSPTDGRGGNNNPWGRNGRDGR